jgi:hypothetical protein
MNSAGIPVIHPVSVCSSEAERGLNSRTLRLYLCVCVGGGDNTGRAGGRGGAKGGC